MIAIIYTTAAATLIYAAIYALFLKNEENKLSTAETFLPGIIIMALIGLIVRIIAASLYYGYSTDMACFSGWSSMMFEMGPTKFYASESFHDYPPGYMYILYVIGALKKVFGDSQVLIKMPAMLFDIAMGIIVFKEARKKFSNAASVTLAGFILLSPALIINSALWGQVDAVYTFFLVASVVMLFNKKQIPAYFLFAISIFIKPQALIYTPVYIISYIQDVILTKDKDKIVKTTIGAVLSIVFMLLLSLPFGISNVFNQYILTLDSYKYATINGFNFYGAFNLNWQPLTPFMSVLGTIFIILIVAYVAFYWLKGNKNYYFLAGVLAFGTYMLCTKMHERYMYPAMLFFILAYIKEPKKESMILFISTTVTQIATVAWVLFFPAVDVNKYAHDPFIIVFSIINIIIFFYMLYCCHILTFDKAKEPVKQPIKTKSVQVKNVTVKNAPKKSSHKTKTRKLKIPKVNVFKSRTLVKMTKVDWGLLAGLCLVYAAISFYDLGDMVAPQTYQDVVKHPQMVTFKTPTYIKDFWYYPSCNELNDTRKMTVTYTDENDVVHSNEISSASVFAWNTFPINATVKDFQISSSSDRVMMMEFAFKDANDKLINVPAGTSKVFDEQNLVPERKTYLNGTIFDEIYHARTAYEFIHGFNVYEWTHPPLGKVIMSLGVRMFGMTPFGWRFAGNIFGIMMIPVFYIFAKRLFKKTNITFLTTVLFTFDFMHFVQTRIATIDVYGTFFIMLMYLLMYKYYQSSFYDTKLKDTFKPLLLTGLAFGLGAASKWTALYACAGIAVIFFGLMYLRYSEYYKYKKVLRKTLPFTENFTKTAVFCVLVFILIPVCIYALSYIPYLNTENASGISTILNNQKDMYIYHSKTVLSSTHPYSSKWYTWLYMDRPIFYYSGTTPDGLREGISAFGNPAVWWLGVPAVLYCLYLAFAKKDRKSIYLLVGYFACLLPWIPVARTTYIYHYFPCVPFMTLMIGRCYSYLHYKNAKAVNIAIICHVVLALVLFAMFYPVLSGHGVTADYVSNFLRWFSSWTLTI